ncbi:MAG: alpha/beta fold hydrolase [bacterium]|nr:alpha/beta fold hydrolase [bacterium]
MHRNNNRNYKASFIITAAFILTCASCSTNKETTKNNAPQSVATAQQDKETSTPEAISIQNNLLATQTPIVTNHHPKAADSTGDTLTEEESNLGITSNGKETFIKKYGKDVYDTALTYCSQALQINQNSEISKTYFNKYRETYQVENLTIKSTYDQHNIPATYIKLDEKENRDTVIFIHGQGCTRFTNMSVAELFLKNGYNILTFDLRSSGENKAKFTTYGALEKYDLLDCVDYIDQKLDKKNKLIVWAGSYGGSVTSVTLGTDYANETIDAAILDSPLDSMETYLFGLWTTQGSKEEFDTVTDSCDKFLKHFYNFSLDDVNGKKAIAKTTVPTLFFGSSGDPRVPITVSKGLYEAATNTNKKMKLFDDDTHCMGSVKYPDVYMKEVKDFLKKNTKTN